MAEFFGEHFDAPVKVNSRRVNNLGVVGLKAQRAEKSGDAAAISEAMMAFQAALEDLVVMVVNPADRDRFDDLCDEHGASDEDLQEFIAAQLTAWSEVKTGRPTGRPSDSSAGSTSTNMSSTGGSFSQDIAELERQGRPDLALVLLERQERRSA